MHADKPKIFPRAIRGFFQNIRHITMALALFVYAAYRGLTGMAAKRFYLT
jgi:hypothetical protein